MNVLLVSLCILFFLPITISLTNYIERRKYNNAQIQATIQLAKPETSGEALMHSLFLMVLAKSWNISVKRTPFSQAGWMKISGRRRDVRGFLQRWEKVYSDSKAEMSIEEAMRREKFES